MFARRGPEKNLTIITEFYLLYLGTDISCLPEEDQKKLGKYNRFFFIQIFQRDFVLPFEWNGMELLAVFLPLRFNHKVLVSISLQQKNYILSKPKKYFSSIKFERLPSLSHKN